MLFKSLYYTTCIHLHWRSSEHACSSYDLCSPVGPSTIFMYACVPVGGIRVNMPWAHMITRCFIMCRRNKQNYSRASKLVSCTGRASARGPGRPTAHGQGRAGPGLYDMLRAGPGAGLKLAGPGRGGK